MAMVQDIFKARADSFGETMIGGPELSASSSLSISGHTTGTKAMSRGSYMIA